MGSRAWWWQAWIAWGLFVALSGVPHPANAGSSSPSSEGYVVPIGGALRYDNHEVWSRLVTLAGGTQARFVVLAMASETPQASADKIVATLQAHGAQALYVPVVQSRFGTDNADTMANAVREVDGASGVFFAGGAQERITAILQPDGRATPVLDAIRRLMRRGGVVAGTSAGAAVMSEVMFRDAQDVLPVMRGQMRWGREIDRGLGFVGPDLFVDQHFLRRGRIGRLLPVMQARRIARGLGVEEDTAAIIHAGQVEVVGSAGVVFVDLTAAQDAGSGGAFGIHGARVTYLESGDRLDLADGRPYPAKDKLQGRLLDPAEPGYSPYYTTGAFYPDMLGDGTLATAMARLLDGRADHVKGLAFAPGAALEDALGFEFHLYKGAGTRGWLTTGGGGERYTLSQVYLDIAPVRFAQPLYGPWHGVPE